MKVNDYFCARLIVHAIRMRWPCTNINGAPEEMTDARGALIWQARYAVWGNTVAEHWHREHRPDPSGLCAQSPLPQNLRMQGQYADPETGLCYNTFRYYDPDIGRFISQDPIGLAGGMNLYQYAPNPISWIDPWGWALTPLNAPGYSTYGLYGSPTATEPYYIGHTNQTLDARLKQHQTTERGGITRADANTDIRPMGGHKEGSLTYSQSKGYEQAYRETHKTKNGFPGNVIEPINKSRTDPRGASHAKYYKQEMKRNGRKPSTC